MATEWYFSIPEELAHAFVRPPCRSVCGLVSWHARLYRAEAHDVRCADCEADVRAEERAKEAKRIAESETPLSELELRWAYGDR